MKPDEEFLRRLVANEPWLQPLLDEHLQDYDDEVLSHLLIGSIAFAVIERGASAVETRSVLARLEEEFGRRYVVDGVIATAFLEMLPFAHEPGAEIVGLLGPKLKAELARQRPSEHPQTGPAEDFVRRISATEDWVKPLLAEHLAATHSRIQPSLLMGEITRQTVARASDPDQVRLLLARIEADFDRQNPELDSFIASSFLARLPSPGEPGSEILSLLGPDLTAGWRRAKFDASVSASKRPLDDD